jgi:16S rRNA (cytidine1402-2'-O)-methyltransferase
VGTLYVVSAPAGDPNDLTRRALRVLEEVALIVADGEGNARQLLDHYGIATPLVPAPRDTHLEALAEADVALLCSGPSPAPSEVGYGLIRRALACGYPVEPAPGPSLLITSLVISGLPADSFVHLGELPGDRTARRELLATVSAEHRSILALAPDALLTAALADLFDTLGDRPLALVASSLRGTEVVWRGSSEEAACELDEVTLPGTYVLVIGGAPDEVTRWDEVRLHSEIESRQAAGMGAKEISQQLARDSGWSRREIYRLSVELARGGRVQEGKTDAS